MNEHKFRRQDFFQRLSLTALHTAFVYRETMVALAMCAGLAFATGAQEASARVPVPLVQPHKTQKLPSTSTSFQTGA